jgi:AraC-like DNA-binding protein
VIVMPTLSDPDRTRASDRPLGSARLWRVDQLNDGVFTVLPDLSQDVVWEGPTPVIVPRTTARLEVPGSRGPGAIGLRLPVAAVDPWIDTAWPGWWLNDPRDPEERVERMVRAVTEGAVTWRVDPWLETLVDALDRPGVRVPRVAADVHMSERGLRRATSARLGLPPGAVAQLLRMWRFARAVRGDRLVAAAIDAGYADQSHAHREVRALGGLRAGQLAAWAAVDAPPRTARAGTGPSFGRIVQDGAVDTAPD